MTQAKLLNFLRQPPAPCRPVKKFVDRDAVGFSLTPHRAKRWRCDLYPDMAVLRNTKSEALAWFAKTLGVDSLPEGAVVYGECV